MLSKEDEILLLDNDYSLELEKYYNPNIYRVLNDKNGTIRQIYAFSNERIDAIFTHFNFKNKRVLTVGSSGDQAFGAIFRGAREVTIIDSNIFTKPYVEYKIAAIKTFSFEDFNKYFIENPNPFNWNIYAKLSHLIDDKSRIFWDTIILNQNDSIETYLNLIHQEKWKVKIISKIFKSREAYDELKVKLDNFKIQYIHSEFNDFANKCNNNYDIILLSNLYKYVTKNGYHNFTNVINDLYINHLNEGGKIQVHYEYNNKAGIPMNIFESLFPDIKTNYIFIGKHFSYYLSKPKNNNLQLKKRAR